MKALYLTHLGLKTRDSNCCSELGMTYKEGRLKTLDKQVQSTEFRTSGFPTFKLAREVFARG
jgi:hypothetical protein